VDARIEQVVTSGTCTLDDTEHEVENNTWIVGDDDEVIVIDPAHEAEPILKAIGDRMVLAIICTHGHEDHLSAAIEVAEHDEEDPAPIALHPRDRKLWRAYFSRLDEKDLPEPDIEMDDGGVFEVADVQLDVLHTPGHTPGSVCLYSDQLGVLFSGDTLHKGRPGEVGGVYPDITSQLNSIGALLGPLPKDTRVLPGHGEETTIGAEDARWESWMVLAKDPDADVASLLSEADAAGRSRVVTTATVAPAHLDDDTDDEADDEADVDTDDEADKAEDDEAEDEAEETDEVDDVDEDADTAADDTDTDTDTDADTDDDVDTDDTETADETADETGDEADADADADAGGDRSEPGRGRRFRWLRRR
jgi:glyoxylase-like metal-dependent hydrolase (beta-lactamase superfamily II)